MDAPLTQVVLKRDIHDDIHDIYDQVNHVNNKTFK